MENAIYVALAISGVINAVLLYVVFQQSKGLAASIPPQAFPLMLDFIKWVVKQTPTKTDDDLLGGLFPDLPKSDAPDKAIG